MPTTGRHNIAKMYSSTTGTGTLTLTTAAPLHNTFADAGVVDGERLRFTITDPLVGQEVSEGIYTSSGLTLTRATVISSTNGGSKIECSGRQTVSITLPAEDIQPFSSYYDNGGDSVTNTSTSNLSLDTEWIDQAGISSLSANAVTLAKKGWYWVVCHVFITAGAAFNGRFKVNLEGFTKTEGYTTAMGIDSDDIYITFLYNAAADSDVIGPVSVTNNVGATVTATALELSFFRIGNA